MSADQNALDGLRIQRGAEPARGGRGRWLVVGLILLLAIAGVLAWLFRSTAPAVHVATVQDAGAAGAASAGGGTVLNASGYVTARRQATVSSKVTGKVLEVLIEEGMEVKQGQVLARLDSLTQDAAQALAEAQLLQARRSLEENEVRLKQATITRNRQHKLLAGGAGTQSDADAADADADSYEARLNLGRQQIVVAEREVAQRRQDHDDTVIRAPFAGVITTKDAQPGEMISPISAGGGFTRTGIGTLVDMASLEVDVDVNESYIHRVRTGQHAEAVLDAYPDWRIPTTVLAVVPAADRQKATVKVRLSFDHLDPRILPDMGVKVAFLADTAPNATPGQARAAGVLVPRAALRQDQGQAIVFVLRGDYVERRAVRLAEGAEALKPAPSGTASSGATAASSAGATSGATSSSAGSAGSAAAAAEQVEVSSGLTAGEQVVLDAPASLVDGGRVVVNEPGR